MEKSIKEKEQTHFLKILSYLKTCKKGRIFIYNISI